LELTRREQLALAGAPHVAEHGAAFARSPAAVDAPCPAPRLPFEAVTDELRRWYEGLSVRFLGFAEGLQVWSAQAETARGEARRVMCAELPREAVRQYESLYAQLAQQAPEFAFWTTQIEQLATRAEVRRPLGGIPELLAEPAGTVRPPVDVAAALARSSEAALTRTVLDASSGPAGIRVPTLREMHLAPDFRVREVAGPSGPATESWWDAAPVCRDPSGYLAGALTSAEQALRRSSCSGSPARASPS
jgi:hypothetical protein